MSANGNRRQTLRTNIIQPYESGFLANVDHKDYNAVVGQELDKVSTATKHMFQGLDDVRKEVQERTQALDALHLTVDEQFRRVMLEISNVKIQLGVGITMDSITDADGNTLSGVLQGLKTEVNTANGSIMVALGEITNLGTKFDGEILQVNQTINANKVAVDAEITRIDGIIVTNKDDLTELITKTETDLTQSINGVSNNVTNLTQLVTTIDSNGTAAYQAQWNVTANVAGLKRGVGFVNDGNEGVFTMDMDKFIFTGGGASNDTVPFQIVNGITQIKQASINNVTIEGAQIRNLTVAFGQVTGDLIGPDWALRRGGGFTIGGTSGTRITMTPTNITFWEGSTARIRIGAW